MQVDEQSVPAVAFGEVGAHTRPAGDDLVGDLADRLGWHPLSNGRPPSGEEGRDDRRVGRQAGRQGELGTDLPDEALGVGIEGHRPDHERARSERHAASASVSGGTS